MISKDTMTISILGMVCWCIIVDWWIYTDEQLSPLVCVDLSLLYVTVGKTERNLNNQLGIGKESTRDTTLGRGDPLPCEIKGLTRSSNLLLLNLLNARSCTMATVG